MAEAYYNHLTKTLDATSAGVDPKTPAKYPQLPSYICEAMAEEGIDVSNQHVKTVNEQIVNNAEKIFVMCSREACPDYLVQSDKVTYWNIADPYQVETDGLKKIRNQIRAKVQSII